jgi:hypothetical protein
VDWILTMQVFSSSEYFIREKRLDDVVRHLGAIEFGNSRMSAFELGIDQLRQWTGFVARRVTYCGPTQLSINGCK